MIDTHHIAWAAGFFDGEGSIGATMDKRDHRISVNMVVVQAGKEDTPPDTLIRFLKIAGCGRLEKRPAANGRLGKKPLWHWRLYQIDQVRSFAARLAPYLGESKLDQIASALARRAEYEGLAADRKMFCGRGGHRIESVGKGVRRGKCRECANEKQRKFRASRRLTAVAAGKET